MNSNLFSVIIPTYNRASTLERAILSVLNQSYKSFELIVINDGSSDDTFKILNKYADQIKIINQENMGVSHARNQGIKISKGNFIAFLDSDDYWHDNKLLVQNDYLIKNPNTQILHCDEIWMRNNKRVNPKFIHAKGGGDQFIRSIELCCISPSAVVVKKSVLNEFGGFREDFPVCEDYDLWLKISYKYNVDYIDQKLLTKTGGHEDQLSSRFKAMDWWRLLSLVTFLSIELNEQKRNFLLDNISKKIKILSKGYIKHSKHDELKRLNDLILKYGLEKI